MYMLNMGVWKISFSIYTTRLKKLKCPALKLHVHVYRTCYPVSGNTQPATHRPLVLYVIRLANKAEWRQNSWVASTWPLFLNTRLILVPATQSKLTQAWLSMCTISIVFFVFSIHCQTNHCHQRTCRTHEQTVTAKGRHRKGRGDNAQHGAKHPTPVQRTDGFPHFLLPREPTQ